MACSVTYQAHGLRWQYRPEGDIMAFRFPFIPRQRICLVAGSFETTPRMVKSEKPQSLPPVF